MSSTKEKLKKDINTVLRIVTQKINLKDIYYYHWIDISLLQIPSSLCLTLHYIVTTTHSALITDWMILSESNSPSGEISIQ
jgi:hypothetical protein